MLTLLPLELPEDVADALQAAGYTSQRLSDEALRYYAAALYRRRLLTLEQAAHLARMSQWDFVPFLGEQDIPVADYDAEETAQELGTARWLMRKS